MQSFDAFGNRIQRDATVNGVSSVEKFVVDGWDTTKPGAIGTENFDVAIDLNASGTVTNRRMFGAGFDELLGGQDGTGAVRWYGTDHLGSVRTVFDNSGTVTNTVDYDAFGSFLGGVPVDPYTGREYDSVTGLTHYRAREKDGHRFLSEDPKGFSAGDANLARYVGNSPTGRRDPSGNFFIAKDGSEDSWLEWFKQNGIKSTAFKLPSGQWHFVFDPSTHDKLKKFLETYFGAWGEQGVTDFFGAFTGTNGRHVQGGPFTRDGRGTFLWITLLDISKDDLNALKAAKQISKEAHERQLELNGALGSLYRGECMELTGRVQFKGIQVSNAELERIRKSDSDMRGIAGMLIGVRTIGQAGYSVFDYVTGIPLFRWKSKRPNAPDAPKTPPELAPIIGVPAFSKGKQPLANPGEMVEAVRQLETGTKPHLKGDILPPTHRLTELQQRGLNDNTRAVLDKADGRLKVGDLASDVACTLEVQLRNPRFRFLDQIPDAKKAVIDIINQFSPAEQERLFNVLRGHGVKIP
jgi:RHS repeat-associated protein